MRILYVTPYAPNRIRVRPFQLLHALVERGHTVTLGAIWSDADECADLAHLREQGVQVVDGRLPAMRSLLNCLLALPTASPLQAAYSWQPGFAKRLARLAQDEPFDVVHVEHLRGSRYGLYLKRRLAASGLTTPVVWDSVDCITHLFRQASDRSATRKGRLVTRFELGRTSRYEPRLLAAFDHTLVTSPADRQALLELASNAGLGDLRDRIRVLPNGVDLAYFVPDETPREPATLVLSGKMSYHANVTAAQQLVREIMPRVWARRPEVAVWIVGKDPARAVLSLANEAEKGRVWVSGTVPDLRPYLRRATIALAPVPYGAGIQNKVLEAMACGAPVIASAQAVSALNIHAGTECRVAHHPGEFAEQILALLENPSQGRELGRAGRAFVEQNHAWSRIGGDLEQLYVSLRPTRPALSYRVAPALLS
jgi:glycosyltransferase involved in cell wall biosynthesis